MSSKSNTEVLIGGKVYTLSGYEGEEYLQKVAAYINSKINEFNEMESVRRFPVDMKSTLLQLGKRAGGKTGEGFRTERERNL